MSRTVTGSNLVPGGVYEGILQHCCDEALARVVLAESDPERGHFLIELTASEIFRGSVWSDSVLLFLAVAFVLQMLRRLPLMQVASMQSPGAPASLRDAELGAGLPILCMGAVLPAQTRSLKQSRSDMS